MLSPTLLKSTLLFLLPLMLKAVPIFLSCHSLISFSINCPPPKITYIFIAALWTVLLDCQANTSSPKYHDENTKIAVLVLARYERRLELSLCVNVGVTA